MTYLWVLQECIFEVDTSTGSVQFGVIAVLPLAEDEILVPGARYAQVGLVWCATNDQGGESRHKIIKRHPIIESI